MEDGVSIIGVTLRRQAEMGTKLKVGTFQS